MPPLRPRLVMSPFRRLYSTEPPPAPPLLLKLRTDLKTAMREKDKPRLSVLRGMLAEVTNTNKGPNPVRHDMQLLTMLRKRKAAAETAQAEFKAAGRQDLVEKEQSEAAVLEEYAGAVKLVDEAEIRVAVEQVVKEKQASAGEGLVREGDVMKVLMGPGGALEGKPMEKGIVSRVVKQTLGTDLKL